MSKGKAIFQTVCSAPDTEQAVKDLRSQDYLLLHSYLIQSYDENGVSGQILGLMLVEGARRYVAAMQWGESFEKAKQVREVLG